MLLMKTNTQAHASGATNNTGAQTRDILDMTTRSVRMVPSTFNAEKNSVRAIATTEKPVKVWDWREYDYVDEILRMDGVILPASGRVPLLDSHSRWGVADVLGSAGDFKEGEAGGYRALDCDVTYSGTDEGASAAQKTREGHLTDYSIGYHAKKSFFVPDGQTQVINGDEYEGPVKVATSWELKEISATPIGADEFAKARSAYLAANNRAGWDPAQQNSREGVMPQSATDPKKQNPPQPQGQRTDAGTTTAAPSGDNNVNPSTSPQQPTTADALRGAAGGTGNPPAGATTQPSSGNDTGAAPSMSAVDVERSVSDAIAAERSRMTIIQQRCNVAGLDDAATNDFIQRGLSVDQVSDEIFKRLEERSPAVGAGAFDVGEEARDKLRDAAIDGISLRSGIPVEDPAAGHEDFRGRSLLRIAEECLSVSGGSVRSLRNVELAGAALGLGARGLGSASTSDFPLIMSAVANKRLLRAYEEAAVTWEIFCNVVDAKDFKPMQSIDISALPELALINENGEYKDVKMTETGESYAIKTYGNMFSLSRQMIINDDLRVFLKIPSMFGAAAKRTINSHVYAMLHSNPTLNDGTALFDASRGNICSISVGTPSSDSLSEGRQLMRKFKDTGGKATLNLRPKYIVAGTKHETNIDLILMSTASIDDHKSSGVVNTWRNSHQPVIDAALDDLDADAWYLFPEKTVADTIEVAFLDGNQTPYTDDWVDPAVDGRKFKCRIDFGVGVQSSKIVKNPGTGE